ncbi:MAG: M24 family metallopeptidase [Alphaproteobacteria bacterium]
MMKVQTRDDIYKKASLPMVLAVESLEPVSRGPLPAKLCNIERLRHAMSARNLDGIIATTDLNVFYLSSFNSIAHKSDEPRPYAVILSRNALEHPIAVIADYYLSSFVAQPSWVQDIRPFRAVMMGLDSEPQADDIERFIPESGKNLSWINKARENYVFNMTSAIAEALKELGLDKGRIAFDDMAFGYRLGLNDIEIVDGYDPLMFARAIKSADELVLIERAQRLNQATIEHITSNWQAGMSWRDLNRAYHLAATALGGFVRDPGAMVWGHPRGDDAVHTLQTGLEDFEIQTGQHIMFDCHGTIDRYCWDGGKTWVVNSEPKGAAKLYAKATADVAEAVLSAMRPGTRISELQALGRKVYRQAGVPEPDRALIFFHGLGLSHMDVEISRADGVANHDWALEEGMVVPLHLLYPGGENERLWLEEVAAITPEGGRPLFSWGFNPICEN